MKNLDYLVALVKAAKGESVSIDVSHIPDVKSNVDAYAGRIVKIIGVPYQKALYNEFYGPAITIYFSGSNWVKVAKKFGYTGSSFFERPKISDAVNKEVKQKLRVKL